MSFAKDREKWITKWFQENKKKPDWIYVKRRNWIKPFLFRAMTFRCQISETQIYEYVLFHRLIYEGEIYEFAFNFLWDLPKDKDWNWVKKNNKINRVVMRRLVWDEPIYGYKTCGNRRWLEREKGPRYLYEIKRFKLYGSNAKGKKKWFCHPWWKNERHWPVALRVLAIKRTLFHPAIYWAKRTIPFDKTPKCAFQPPTVPYLHAIFWNIFCESTIFTFVYIVWKKTQQFFIDHCVIYADQAFWMFIIVLLCVCFWKELYHIKNYYF